MLQRRTALTPYDADCYVLFSCAIHLHGHANPTSRWMESTPFYKRGMEVRDEWYGPVVPSHLNPEYPRQTFASLFFQAIHDCIPRPGDILRYDELTGLYSRDKLRNEVEQIQCAWGRRIIEYTCPFKFDDGKVLIRQDDGSWQPGDSKDPDRWWNYIEEEAFGREDWLCYTPCATPGRPRIEAVTFIASQDGKRRVKPFEPAGTTKQRAEDAA